MTIKEKDASVRNIIMENIGEIEKDGPLWGFFYSLILNHPEQKEKIGAGLKKIILLKSWAGHPCMLLVRVDGSRVDISWKTCLSGKPKKQKQNLYNAMRREVDCQVRAFKGNFKEGIICQFCQREISEGESWHVDHEIKFKKIADDFITHYPCILPEDFDDDPITNMPKFKREDIFFSIEWYSHHRNKAKLRFLHAKCNMKRH